MNQPIAVGSLVAAPYSVYGGRWLGLVVDQDVGKKWADGDPCIEYELSDECGPLLVRVLGQKLTEGGALGRSSLPEREPCETETVRWAWAQMIPNPPIVIAGPDADSIAGFLRQCLILGSLRRDGESTFLYDLEILVDYLRGVEKTKYSTGMYAWKFYKMLEEVLPR